MPASSIHSYEYGFYWRENNRIYASFWMPPAYIVKSLVPKSLQISIDDNTWGWYYSWEVEGWSK